ncbi:MAG: VWA domain-containing protein [Bacilli bacterium]|nr:VWA domain-containing protein [Bacilli bacterium]
MAKKKKDDSSLVKIVIFIFIFVAIIKALGNSDITGSVKNYVGDKNTLNILSSYENSIVEDEVVKYAKSINKKVHFVYKGDLDIVEELNNNSKEYDAVWISNSMWLYLLDNPYLATDSKSISISPVVFGIKKSKAKELNLINTNVTNDTIINLIKEKKIKYVMSSVTQTNTGATAYLGFLSALAGNPEVLTEEMLRDQTLIDNMVNLFSGVERVSGEDNYLSEMFLNSDDYEAVIASEASLIEINKELVKKKKEPLYLIYPTDGVAINDSTFGFINNNPDKEETFLSIQSYLLSDKGKKTLADNGLRTWYGGINKDSDSKTFNKEWGIDTSKYLNVTKFPSKSVITSALNLYIESLRKPTHVVFCLDYSGSMSGTGKEELTAAMDYILNYETASKDKLQFSEKDKITIIPFASTVRDVWSSNGYNTGDLIDNIHNENPSGTTALYDAVIKGLNILDEESDDYTKTIIAMTDGNVNVGTFSELRAVYNKKEDKVPIYSITFGSAEESQLEEIAELSNARVFDGKTDLLKAFKKVRGYN